MKRYGVLLLMVLLLPLALAVDVSVEKQSSDEVMILGTSEPAIFDLSITNNGPTDNFTLYTFLGTGYSPKESFEITQGKTKNIQFAVLPPYDITRIGVTVFDYYTRGSDNSEHKGQLSVKIIEFGNAFEISSSEVNPESTSMELYFKNTANFDFKELSADFSSFFFDLEETFALAPHETKTFQIALDKERFRTLKAGFYTIDAEVKGLNKTASIDGTIEFVEKNIITTNDDTAGFIVRIRTITKVNEGNKAEITETIVNKNIISRLFTSFNIQPDSSVREGSKVIYSWSKELQPGEKFDLKVKTNWLLPLIFVVLLVAIVVFVNEHTKNNLILKKKTIFVKSKGGEFALKISVNVHAKKQIDNVRITERVPMILKLYDKFEKERPSNFNDKAKKLEWEFRRLEEGEKRVLSYIAYSKIGVVGKFALPRSAAVYEMEGKHCRAKSNKVFFVTEPRRKEGV